MLRYAFPLALFATPALAQDPCPPEHAAMGHCTPATADAPHQTMQSPLGPYAMSRDGSGTSWLPDANDAMVMDHAMAGDWMVMHHATLDLIHSDQGGPRGDEKTFVAGMVMAQAWRPLGPGTLNLRAMLSPDPLMGKEGYPLLLAVGETADGVTHLVDRQHPHDLFMELSASFSRPVGNGGVFVYAGLPGEPAFGPPAFMHRPAAMTSPEAPISHHWLDSTHITFGVLTAGYVRGAWKTEVSAFRGREPDQDRYDIESPRLDSASARLSWNPSPNWSLQVSAAYIESPEQLDPTVDEDRISVSALYSGDIAGRPFDATLAFARKDTGEASDAWLAEASYVPFERLTLFTRAEQVVQDELDPLHTPFKVRKLSLGGLVDVAKFERGALSLGALVSAYDLPAPLKTAYGSPTSGMAFVRLSLH